MDCNKTSDNMKMCNCTYEPCARKGHCCECLHYHRQKGQAPACFFPAEMERTYNRSLKFLAAAHK